jgi:hypothetical protein
MMGGPGKARSAHRRLTATQDQRPVRRRPEDRTPSARGKPLAAATGTLFERAGHPYSLCYHRVGRIWA